MIGCRPLCEWYDTMNYPNRMIPLELALDVVNNTIIIVCTDIEYDDDLMSFESLFLDNATMMGIIHSRVRLAPLDEHGRIIPSKTNSSIAD